MTKLLKKLSIKRKQKVLLLSLFCSVGLLSLNGCVSERVISTKFSQGTSYEKALNSYLDGEFQNAKGYIKKVKKEDKDYQSAQLLKKKVTRLSDRLVTKYLQIGTLYEEAGIIPKAEAVYKVASIVNPDSNRAKKKLKNLSLREKEKFIQIKPKLKAKKVLKVNVAKYYADGKAAYKKGHFSRAIEKFHTVLKNDPSFRNTNQLVVDAKKKKTVFINTHLKRGIHAYQQENLEDAVKEWKLVLREDPKNLTALSYKAKAESIMKKLKALRK